MLKFANERCQALSEHISKYVSVRPDVMRTFIKTEQEGLETEEYETREAIRAVAMRKTDAHGNIKYDRKVKLINRKSKSVF